MATMAKVQSAAKNLKSRLKILDRSMELGKRYEAWLMLEIGIRLRTRDCKTRWMSSAGSRINRAIFRDQPGAIYPATAGQGNPGYIEIVHKFRPQQYELHNSVQYCGLSNVLHEIDVSIIKADDARYIRSSLFGGDPYGDPAVSLELKCLAKYFPVGHIRSMVFNAFDLSMGTTSIRPDVGWRVGRKSVALGQLSGKYRAAITSAYNLGSSDKLANFYRSKTWDTIGATAAHAPRPVHTIDEMIDDFYSCLYR